MKHHLALAATLLLIGTPVYAQMPPPHPAPMPRTISVSGEASEQFAPDRAILNVSLISKNMEINQAKRENDRLTKKVVSVLSDFDIAKEKIANSQLYISPEYRYEHKKQVLKGYTVNRSLRITMDDISIHERVLSDLIKIKVSHVGGVQFALKDRKKYSTAIQAKAFKNAKAKAEAMAKVAGVKLGKPISISTGHAAPFHPPRHMMDRGMVAMEQGNSVAPSLPGMITISQSVNVVFEME